MAGASLFALLDDIATLLDDVAVLTKTAASKTAGVLGDDLALNAQQVAGVSADRELPVVWAVAKGSAMNKVILVPAALAISYFANWLIIPLLMIGGAFLCYEGVEKLTHRWLHSKQAVDAEHAAHLRAVVDTKVDMVEFEKEKIKGAIRTDFILSAEIIVIALGTIASQPFVTQVGVLIAVAVLITVVVYGLVAGIVKLDDVGLYLTRSSGAGASAKKAFGELLLRIAPKLMKFLSVAGMAAMFLVGGAILAHGIPVAHHGIEHVMQSTSAMLPVLGALTGILVGSVLEALLGIVAGIIVLAAVLGIGKLFQRAKPAH